MPSRLWLGPSGAAGAKVKNMRKNMQKKMRKNDQETIATQKQNTPIPSDSAVLGVVHKVLIMIPMGKARDSVRLKQCW